MHIAIMSRNKNLYSTSRLKEAAEARGHVIKIVDPLKCYMNINMNAPSIHVRGEELPKFDAYWCICHFLWYRGIAPV